MQSDNNVYTVATGTSTAAFATANTIRAAVVAADADTVNTTNAFQETLFLILDDMRFYILQAASGTAEIN